MRDLESLRPYIPGICRLRLLIYSILHFLNNLLWLVLILAAVGGFCYIVYRIKQARQSRTKQRAMRVREVVREVSCKLGRDGGARHVWSISCVCACPTLFFHCLISI